MPTPKKFLTWGLLLIAGIIFLSIGILAFIDPLSSYVKLTKFTGIALLLNGGLLLSMVIIRPRTRESDWMQAESILHFFFGIIFVFNPLLAFIALPYFIGSWIFLVGILKVLAALFLKNTMRGWAFILLVGSLCGLFGALMLFSPFARATSITILIGIFGVIMGSLYIIDAFRYRKRPDTLDMML